MPVSHPWLFAPSPQAEKMVKLRKHLDESTARNAFTDAVWVRAQAKAKANDPNQAADAVP